MLLWHDSRPVDRLPAVARRGRAVSADGETIAIHVPLTCKEAWRAELVVTPDWHLGVG